MEADWSTHAIELRKQCEAASALMNLKQYGAALTCLDLAAIAFQNYHAAVQREMQAEIVRQGVRHPLDRRNHSESD